MIVRLNEIMKVNKNKKLVITCITLPPLVIGSTVLMTNLFKSYKGDIEALAGWEYGAKKDSGFAPPCKTHYLKFYPLIIQRIIERFSPIYFFLIRWFIYFKLKNIKPSAVFAACTPDGLFFTASFIACKKLDIPFWGHMHDLWLENTREGTFKRKLAETWEPIIFNDADKIFCMTDTQLSYYQNKYSGKYEIIPHCVNNSEINKENLLKKLEEKFTRQRKTILYTGNISSAMNLEAIQFFVSTIDLLPENYDIIMLTSYNEETAKKLNVYHPRIQYGWVSVAEAQKKLGEVDLLLLPLSFKNCSEKEVETVFATKTLDYLTSGTPILVYSPAKSFHSQSASKNGWGFVVNEESTEKLVNSIEKVLSEKSIQRNLIVNAFIEAESRNASIYAYKILKFVENANKQIN